jgi:hypothetical protein
MAFFRQAFARAGAAPDLAALANALRPTLGDPFYVAAQLSSGGVVTVVVDKPTAWSGGDSTTVQSAVTAAAASTPQTEAQNAIDAMSIFDKAVLLTINDELNLLRVATSTATKTPAQMAALVRAKAATL